MEMQFVNSLFGFGNSPSLTHREETMQARIVVIIMWVIAVILAKTLTSTAGSIISACYNSFTNV